MIDDKESYERDQIGENKEKSLNIDIELLNLRNRTDLIQSHN